MQKQRNKYALMQVRSDNSFYLLSLGKNGLQETIRANLSGYDFSLLTDI